MYVSIRNLDFYCRVYSTEIIVKRVRSMDIHGSRRVKEQSLIINKLLFPSLNETRKCRFTRVSYSIVVYRVFPSTFARSARSRTRKRRKRVRAHLRDRGRALIVYEQFSSN